MWGLSSLCFSRPTCHVSVPTMPGEADYRDHAVGPLNSVGFGQWEAPAGDWRDRERTVSSEYDSTLPGNRPVRLPVNQRTLLLSCWLALHDALLPHLGNHFLCVLLGLWIVSFSAPNLRLLSFFSTLLLWRVPLWINHLSLGMVSFSCWDPDKLFHGYNRLH